ncbi:MAG: DegT/DnrJ/EryC1/StrS aminotransferase family protein [Pseudomonadota bacterium]
MNQQISPPDIAEAAPPSVPFFRHALNAGEAQKVAAVLGTPILTSGQVGRDVEAQLCDYFGAAHAKLTNSWTNGAVAVLLALGIGPGDEVIVPAMTFIASANVVELVGATAVFVDVDPETLLMDLDAIAAARTPKTKAIIPVHLYGQMVDMRRLRAIAGPEIFLIEDCAHAFESALKGARPGALSDAAIFSFYATKNVTCGEGGAIISNDAALMAEIRQTILHGMSAGADKRFEGALYRHWEMERLGTKANLPDLLACLLPDQIASVGERREIREALVARYHAAFAETPGMTMVRPVSGGTSAHHLFAIAAPFGARDRVMHGLNTAGIGATVNYRAVPTMGYYQAKYAHPPERFPNAYNWGERTLSLPLFPGLTEAEQARVIDAVAAIFGALDLSAEDRIAT